MNSREMVSKDFYITISGESYIFARIGTFETEETPLILYL